MPNPDRAFIERAVAACDLAALRADLERLTSELQVDITLD